MYKEEAVYNNDGEKVYSRSIQFTGRFHDNRGYSLYANGKSINFRLQEYPPSLNKNDLANLVLLAHHLQLDTNALTYRTNKGKKPMDIERMGKVIGIGERQARRFIKKTMNMGIIKRVAVTTLGGVKTVQYVMNPVYFLNGKHISDYLYWTFQEQLDKVLPVWAKEQYLSRKEGGL